MAIQLGPILGFQGAHNDTSGQHWWHIGVLVVTDDPNPPTLLIYGESLPECKALPLKTHGQKHVWRYDLKVLLGTEDKNIRYFLDEQAYAFTAPAKESIPRIAYTSCNGFSTLKLMKQVKDKFANWRTMEALHERQAYHLLIMGGDQVYADPLWEIIPELRECP